MTLLLLLGCKTAPDLVGTWEGTCAPSGATSDAELALRLRAVESDDGYSGFADVDDGSGEVELTFEAQESDARVGIAVYPNDPEAAVLWIFGLRDAEVIRGTCGYPTEDDAFVCTLGCSVLSEAEKLSLTGEADLVRTSKPATE